MPIHTSLGLFDVKAYGAKGDGATDDRTAIQAALTAASVAGGIVWFPAGTYCVSGELLIQSPYVQICGSGWATTTIKATAATGEAVIRFQRTVDALVGTGWGICDLTVDNNSLTTHGIIMNRPYDGVYLTNIEVLHTVASKSGVILRGVGALVGQTVIMQNVLVYKLGDTVASEPTIYLKSIQEAQLIGCKAFAGLEGHKGDGSAIKLEDCRTITLVGCSSASTTGYGIEVAAVTRFVTGITVLGHLYEATQGMKTTAAGGGIVVAQGCHFPARYESATGDHALGGVSGFEFHNGTHAVTVGADSINVAITTTLYSLVTDGGTDTSIIAFRNATDDRMIIKQGLDVQAVSTPMRRFIVAGRANYWEERWDASAGVDNGYYIRHFNGSAYADILRLVSTAIKAGVPIEVDTVNEKTAAAGVTVDGLLLKDGGLGAAATHVGLQTFGNGVAADTVAEKTAAAGVTVDGLLLKDGGLGAAATHVGLQTFGNGVASDTVAEKTAAAGVTVDGLLLKDGMVGAAGGSIGFYGIGPVARPAAYTQTYATADKTHAARVASAITDNTGGSTADATLAAIPDPADTPVTADNLRDDLVTNVLPKIRDALAKLAAQHNNNRTDHLDTAQLANSLLDDLQAEGLLQ